MSFVGNRWDRFRKERKNYLKNVYRVLFTRARQEMVIVIPPRDEEDVTTYEYLKGLGLVEV